MAEIRKLSKTEIAQADILSAALAEHLDKVCSEEQIENFGVVSAAFLVILSSIIIECLDEEERLEAVRMFFDHVANVIKLDGPVIQQIN
jgi:hypothetical protein